MRPLLLLAFSVTLSLSAHSQAPTSEDQKAAQTTIQDAFAALSARDSVALKNHCTDDVLFFEYGQIWNLDTLVRKAIAKNTPSDFKRTNQFEFIRTQTDKEMAWASYHLYSEITSKGRTSAIHWLETVVLVRKEKKWKIKLLHSTMISRK